MAPAKGGRRNDRHEKEATTATRSGRRPVGFAFSKFGRRLAAQHARRKAVKERGSRKRGRAGLAGGTRRKCMCNPINSLLVRHPFPSKNNSYMRRDLVSLSVFLILRSMCC